MSNYKRHIKIKCPACGELTDEFHKAHVHHIKPSRYGGQGDEPNLAILCGMCHKRIHSFYEQAAMWDALARNPDFFSEAYSKFIKQGRNIETT